MDRTNRREVSEMSAREAMQFLGTKEDNAPGPRNTKRPST
jgi:hypothetical protein